MSRHSGFSSVKVANGSYFGDQSGSKCSYQKQLLIVKEKATLFTLLAYLLLFFYVALLIAYIIKD
jgi:hypothetical protein